VLQGYFGPVRIDGDGDISDNLDLNEVAQDEL
jgi:hypothetical protein